MIIITGYAFKYEETILGVISVDERNDYLWISLDIGGVPYLFFPMKKDSDSNEINLRTANIINQSGLVDTPVKVLVAPVE